VKNPLTLYVRFYNIKSCHFWQKISASNIPESRKRLKQNFLEIEVLAVS